MKPEERAFWKGYYREVLIKEGTRILKCVLGISLLIIVYYGTK